MNKNVHLIVLKENIWIYLYIVYSFDKISFYKIILKMTKLWT